MITNGGTYTTKTSVSSNTYCCLTKIWCSARGSNTYNCWFYPTIRCQVIIKQRGAPKVKCCTYAKERTYPTGTTVPLCEFEMIIPSLSIKHFHKVACLSRICFCVMQRFSLAYMCRQLRQFLKWYTFPPRCSRRARNNWQRRCSYKGA